MQPTSMAIDRSTSAVRLCAWVTGPSSQAFLWSRWGNTRSIHTVAAAEAAQAVRMERLPSIAAPSVPFAHRGMGASCSRRRALSPSMQKTDAGEDFAALGARTLYMLSESARWRRATTMPWAKVVL